MKLKIFSTLMICVLFTGCANGDIDSAGKNSSVQAQVESMENEMVTESSNESATMAETSAESASETTNESEAASEAFVVSFEASTIDGEALTSECFSQSKLTMINVWATYCNPCLSEMPDLGEIAASYDTTDFQIIGIISDVAVESDEETIANAKDLINQTQANYPHLLLNESLYVNLLVGVDSVPTSFFVNQKGELLGYIIGAQSKEVWEELIAELLADNE